ncbi:MAG: Glyoxalase/bleomycin resistance protein/dioxygenase [Sphingomonas bacterium]|uniref:VOC family protein n=1 Tax=Sphingomonas bacterium TaxID=1895847 RepID=UPI00260D9D41|nr:VOC family protein [Sphingomonas bacterium]MDB5704683.1 Glyoxalase/bleomycin resistance protein/dioxygenase [Sphingomonas bacterium]
MFSHITLGTNDLERSRRFYEPVMATLGVEQPFKLPGTLVFGALAGPKLFIVSPFDGGTASQGNGQHAAFLAPTRAAVDTFHAAALANGGTDEGAPGLRPQYHAHYYGAYVRDPDGNKLQAVSHRRPDDTAA